MSGLNLTNEIKTNVTLTDSDTDTNTQQKMRRNIEYECFVDIQTSFDDLTVLVRL